MEDLKKAVGKSFDEMFGEAQEFIPDPADIVEGEFDALDEEDAGGEDELAEMDCTGIAPSDEAADEPDKAEDDDSELLYYLEDEDNENEFAEDTLDEDMEDPLGGLE